MATTSLVRSSSSSNNINQALARTSGSSSITQTPTRSPSSSTTATTILPKLGNLVSTPSKSAPKPLQQLPSPAVSTPGKWQHPRMDEVIQRQNKTRFDNTNVRLILWNIAFLGATFAFSRFVLDGLLPRSWLRAIYPGPLIVLTALRAFFLYTIFLALVPRFRVPDACEDVPLTPAQRTMLGLPPMSRPATPQEQGQYVTPPRFSRSATPQSSGGRTSLRAYASESPLSVGGGTGSTPYEFGDAARSGGGGGGGRRLSFNSTRSSPLSLSEFDAAGTLGTPTKGNRASVGLNNKWLYEKGRGSPRGSPRLSLAGGSVFT